MEGAIDRLHEDPAQEREDGHAARRSAAVRSRPVRPALGRVVGRRDDAAVVLEDRHDFPPLVDVVAERHAVDAGGQQFLEDRRRNARSACGVLGIGHDQVDLLFAATSPASACVQDLPPRFADDVADERSRRHGV